MTKLTQAERLTPAQLEAIRERVEKAAAGPWYVGDDEFGMSKVVGAKDTIAYDLYENEANFIAHAREDIPKLLAEIERLKINLRDVQQELTKVTQLLDGAYEILHDDDWYRNHPLAVDIIRYFERG